MAMLSPVAITAMATNKEHDGHGAGRNTQPSANQGRVTPAASAR